MTKVSHGNVKRMGYFEDIDWVVGAISRKGDGSMKNPLEKGNKKLFLEKLGLKPVELAVPLLEHGSSIKLARKGNVGSCDGLVTNKKGIILSLTVADCLPLFFLDTERRAIGLIHAGWRGLVKGIIGNTITMFSKEFDSKAGIMRVVIGPGICRSHFEVGQDVASRFKRYPSAIDTEGERKFVDIKKVAQTQLVRSGLNKNNIEIDGDCTFCLNRKYFSYRRDHSRDEAMLSVFALKK